jgi:copper homeostasis protein
MTIIEVCAANVESALVAQKAGASRIELCSALEVGGVTPSAGLVRAAVALLHIPVCVLIRPRPGHFCFQLEELSVMCDDIAFCRESGAAGVVIGALTDTFDLDTAALEAMKEAAGHMEIIFHRAFDFVNDPNSAMETLIQMGFSRILTSGQAISAWEGRAQIAAWVKLANNRITIMPGGGISENNIVALKSATNAQDFHLSAKTVIDLPNAKPLQGLDTAYFISDESKIIRTIASV